LSHREGDNQSDLQGKKETEMSTNNVNGKIYANTDANSLSKSVDALREVLGEGARVDVSEDRFSCKVSFSLSTMDDIDEYKIVNVVKEILGNSEISLYNSPSGDLSFIDLRKVGDGEMPKVSVYDFSRSREAVVECSNSGDLYVDRDALLEFNETITEF
jgi:hypothetical protein